MKNRETKSMNFQHILLVIMGLIMIGWNTAGYTISNNWQEDLKTSKHQADETSTTPESEDEYWLVIGEAVMPLVGFQLVHDLIIEFELEVPVEDQEITGFLNLIPLNHYFETLFQRIISPNAP